MNLKRFLLVLATFTIPIVSSTVPEMDPKLNFVNIMARSLDLIQKNSGRNLSCFPDYVEKMNECSQLYDNQLVACNTIADNRRAKIENDTLGTQTDFANNVDYFFANLKECREKEGAKDIFVCYSEDSLNSFKGLNNMHNNATVIVTSLNKNFDDIQYEQSNCTNNARIEYEKISMDNYQNLGKCLEGITTKAIKAPATSDIYPTHPKTSTAETGETIKAEEEENKTESLDNDRVQQSKYISLQNMLGSPRFHI